MFKQRCVEYLTTRHTVAQPGTLFMIFETDGTLSAIMNNTTLNETDTASLVQKINDKKVQTLIPAIVYIALLMVTGLVGNLMVFFFYAFKTKTVPTSIFIVTLAIYDLIFCSVSMPVEIVDIVWFYTYTNSVACKFLRFVNYSAIIASALTLMSIAVDRFRQIRRATRKQMTVRDSKKVCVLVAGGTFLVTWPTLVIHDTERILVPNESILELLGYDCTFVKSDSYKPYVWAYNIIIFVGFIVFASALAILYGMIAYKIYAHRNTFDKYQLNSPPVPRITPSCNASSLGNAEEIRMDSTFTTNTDLESSRVCENPSDCREMNKSNADNSVPVNNEVRQSTDAARNTETTRLALLMLTVTSVFVLSFMPYLCLVIWQSITGIHEGELSDAALVGFRIGHRSYLLNSAINPWIYGSFNRKFRQYYFRLFCNKLLKK